MANVIPFQLLDDGSVVRDMDHSYSNNKEFEDVLKLALGNNANFFKFYSGQRVVTGSYKNNNKKIFFMVANVTFMGGEEGQHPLDLKRIQYNYHWKEFYDTYSDQGEVKWLGLYSYRNINIIAEFKPETYLKKHKNNLVTKNGKTAQYSCHIFLNDLYQGYRDGYFSKIDKQGNVISAISFDNLKNFFQGKTKENPIISRIKNVNNTDVPWNRWIKADEAIKFMYTLYTKYTDRPNFKNFRQNLWNGWYIEALYSENIINNPTNEISYLATEKKQKTREEYETGLDLAFPKQKFVGDLKAMSINGSGDSLLNDETKINNALSKFKRIWFIIYMHDTRPGKTNDYEMVKWRNHFISKVDGTKLKDEMSAPRTPHSVKYEEMIVIELNEVTKEKYFSIGKQFGLNSNGKERNFKYKINKKILKDLSNEDSMVIYREKH